MNEQEGKLNSAEEKKIRIRERYRGVDEDRLTVIPAVPRLDIFDKDRHLRVAVYARVSTDDPNQTTSFELQRNHYSDLIARNPNWSLVDIYADEGISGTSLEHRHNFVRMIDDCLEGKIDLIVTKSVSRFARNILDSIGYIRKLGALNPPVGVFFETENINTLNSQSEMQVAFLSTMAQEESHTKSDIMNASIEMRFRKGIFLTPPLLGYDLDEDGRLVINEEEARTVRLIFFMYLYGYSCPQIADTLMSLKRKTKKGNTRWHGSTVMQQLQNERHCGTVIARKTWTPSFIDHKSRKNRKDRNQYVMEDHHEAIISREDFIAVQHIIQNSKCGNKSILPELHVIPDGILKGFVAVNPRWSGFRPEDYLAASKSVQSTEEPDFDLMLPERGGFDLTGYEVVRSQFLDFADKLTVSFSASRIKFSAACLKRFGCNFVSILIHPKKRIFIVKPARESDRLAFRWARLKDNALLVKEIGAAAILPCIFGILGWNMDYRYRIQGMELKQEGSHLLIFNAEDSEIFLPNARADDLDSLSVPDASADVQRFGTKSRTLAFPASWAEGFGRGFYYHQSRYETAIQKPSTSLVISRKPAVFMPDPSIKIPAPEDMAEKIELVMDTIRQESVHE